MRRVLTVTALLTPFLVGDLLAQNMPNTAEMAVKLSDQDRLNALALKQYSWTSRLEQFKKGESKGVKLFKARFDTGGKFEMTPMGGTPEKKNRGIRGAIQRSKQKKAKEFVQEVAELVQTYTHASTGTLLDFFNKATFAPGKGAMKNTLQVKGSDFIKPGDSVTFWYDAATKKPRRIQFRTMLEEDFLDAVVDYSVLKDGTYYAARTVVKVPEEEIRVEVENFDHIKQGA